MLYVKPIGIRSSLSTKQSQQTPLLICHKILFGLIRDVRPVEYASCLFFSIWVKIPCDLKSGPFETDNWIQIDPFWLKCHFHFKTPPTNVLCFCGWNGLGPLRAIGLWHDFFWRNIQHLQLVVKTFMIGSIPKRRWFHGIEPNLGAKPARLEVIFFFWVISVVIPKKIKPFEGESLHFETHPYIKSLKGPQP